MADFKVAFTSAKIETYMGDAAWDIRADAVLEVRDGEGRRFFFSPAGWLCVEDSEPRPDS